MTSSWTPVASGVTLAVACAADELEAHFAVRHRIFVEEQRLFSGTDRDSHDDEPDTVHAIASADGEVVGAVRLYPLHGDVWKGDRLAVLSRRARAPARRAARAIRRPHGRRARRIADGRPGAGAQRAVLRAPRMGARRSGGPLRRGHAPADGHPASTPNPVSGVLARSQTDASRPSAASRSTLVSSNRPHAAHASPRRWKTAAARPACSGAAASRNPKLGNVSSQRSSGAPSGRGRASRSSIGAGAGALDHLQQRAGDPRHRHVPRGVAEPGLGDLDERVAVGAQARRVAVVERAEERPRVAHVPAVGRERGEQHVAGPRGGRAERALREPGAGRGERRGVAEREMPADDRHAEPLRRPRDAVQHGLGVRAIGRDEHVDDAERAGAHRADVGHVRDHRGRAGAERVVAQERRRDRLAADDDVPVAVREERSVVAVDAGARRLTTARSRLASRPGAVLTAAASASRFGTRAIESASVGR